MTIPSSVNSIGSGAFQKCTDLASVTVKATSVPTLINYTAFPYSNEGFKIYVPYGKGADYQAADKWNNNNIKNEIFEAYIVDDKPAVHGTVTVDKDCFPTSDYTTASETVTVTVTPDNGYQLKADSLIISYNDGEAKTITLTAGENNTYTFTMPKANVTVTAAFEKITDEVKPAPMASVFSNGNLWIIVAVAVVALGGVAALVIVKKKKKPALASGTDTNE